MSGPALVTLGVVVVVATYFGSVLGRISRIAFALTFNHNLQLGCRPARNGLKTDDASRYTLLAW